MDIVMLLKAALLGLLEGATEFIPVSSTGHLLLAEHFLGFSSPGQTFEVLIQLGAVLAVVSVYFNRLWSVARALPSSIAARRFVLSVLIAFLPAAFIGALLHGFIKEVLFNPFIVCSALIVGGFILMIVDTLTFPVTHTDAMRYPPPMALKIGFFQCLAMIPGVSRSGATIVGAMLLGADKRSAAEFSFFLAIPTMAGAFAYDLYKNYAFLNTDSLVMVAVGFVMAFISGLFVVKTLLNYISTHGFTPFAWWRIGVGAAGLAGLLLFG